MFAGADVHAATVTVEGAFGGTIMGTPAYMSPEQARGLPVDKRTDIWSFGCVLFEMITGDAAFKGEHASDVVANILVREPDPRRAASGYSVGDPASSAPVLRKTCVNGCAMPATPASTLGGSEFGRRSGR